MQDEDRALLRRHPAGNARSRRSRSRTLPCRRVRPARRSAGLGRWPPMPGVAAPPRSTRGRGSAGARHRSGRRRAASGVCARPWRGLAGRRLRLDRRRAGSDTRSPSAGRRPHGEVGERFLIPLSGEVHECWLHPPSFLWRPAWTRVPVESQTRYEWFDLCRFVSDRSGHDRRPELAKPLDRGRPRRRVRGSARASLRGPRAGSPFPPFRCR